MQIEPAAEAFAARFARAEPQVVWTTLVAGLFGYLGYDMARLMEESPPPNPDPIGLPDAMMIRPTVVIVFDAVQDMITIVTPVRQEGGMAASTAYARASERLSAVVDALDR